MGRILHFWTILAYCAFAGHAAAQDISALGGGLTSNSPIEVALQLPAPNLGSDELEARHLAGHSGFHSTFEFRTINNKPVIGPRFNNTSCGGCHQNDGRGAIRFGKRRPGSTVLIKVSRRGTDSTGGPKPIPGIGTQIQEHRLTGAAKYSIRLRWTKVRGKYPDGTSYELRKPRLRFSLPGVKQSEIRHSLRMTPPIVGMGLLEAISQETINGFADPEDLNSDGISGKVNLVHDVLLSDKRPGRFGFKASQTSVKQQTAAAFFNDMGMTSSLFLPAGSVQEVSDELLDDITFYQRASGIPPARDQDSAGVVAGKGVFQTIGCNGCHKFGITTSSGNSVAALDNQVIHPFTDLLLHDMGPGLSDRRPTFLASGSEWRTTPLWGLGLHGFLSEDAPGYLHDGRARTLEEAILWHGGEAADSRRLFTELPASERAQLIEFLGSL